MEIERKNALRNLLFKTWNDTNGGQNISTPEELEVVATVMYTLSHLDIFDYTKGSSHKDCFKDRYLSFCDNMKLSQLSERYGFCRDTASVYSNNYLEIFGTYYSIIKELPLERNREYVQEALSRLLDINENMDEKIRA